MQPDGMRTSRVVALAFLVGLFFVAQEALVQLAAGRPVPVVNDVEVVLRFWAVWALLAPLVVKALRRWPLDTKPMYVPIVAHVSVAVVLAVLQSSISVVLYPTARALFGTGSFRAGLEMALRQDASPVAFTAGVFTGVFFYAVAVIAYAAARFRARSAGLEAELTRSKLDMLRSQLRPHFLFNTLNAISVFVTEDGDKARRMLLHLSTLLRRSLDEEAHEVPLRQELGFVDDYVEIQRGRFGDQLRVQFDVDPAVLDARFPVFLLQPLLENAMEHGKSDDNRTAIALRAQRDDDELRLTVEDDGPGVQGGASEGVGLRNTRARLYHLYGVAASVQLRAASGSRGTCVEIRIPFSEAAQ
jgi:two-component system, LytTR family, sensor kinase